MITYYIGDIDYQDRLLKSQLKGFHPSIYLEARRRMIKRVMKHFGMLNKYDGKGNLRK